MAVVPVDRFGRPLADWWQRLLAIILDGIILAVPKIIVEIIVLTSFVASGGVFSSSFQLNAVLIGIAFSVIDIGYFALLNGGSRGQTVGQMALGITVRDEQTGGAVGPSLAGLRIIVLYPGLLVGWIPFLGLIGFFYTLVAGLSPLWDDRRQGFHDKVAHTDVIKVR